MSEQQNKSLSLFECIVCSIFAIFAEYSTYAMYLGDGYQVPNTCHSGFCRIAEWAWPVAAPMLAIIMSYGLLKNAPFMWFIAQVFVVYFIFF